MPDCASGPPRNPDPRRTEARVFKREDALIRRIVEDLVRLLPSHVILAPNRCVPKPLAGRMFRQEVPTIGLSIEQGTGSVPNDGRFHVVVEGNVVFSSKAKSAALTRYRSLRDELLQKAGIVQTPPDPEETKRREREFYDFQAVFSESMRQRTINAKRKGGKGGSGGVS